MSLRAGTPVLSLCFSGGGDDCEAAAEADFWAKATVDRGAGMSLHATSPAARFYTNTRSRLHLL